MTFADGIVLIASDGFDLIVFEPDLETADGLTEVTGDIVAVVTGFFVHAACPIANGYYNKNRKRLTVGPGNAT